MSYFKQYLKESLQQALKEQDFVSDPSYGMDDGGINPDGSTRDWVIPDEDMTAIDWHPKEAKPIYGKDEEGREYIVGYDYSDVPPAMPLTS